MGVVAVGDAGGGRLPGAARGCSRPRRWPAATPSSSRAAKTARAPGCAPRQLHRQNARGRADHAARAGHPVGRGSYPKQGFADLQSTKGRLCLVEARHGGLPRRAGHRGRQRRPCGQRDRRSGPIDGWPRLAIRGHFIGRGGSVSGPGRSGQRSFRVASDPSRAVVGVSRLSVTGGPRATYTSAGGVNWKGSDVNVFRARSSSVAFANDAFVAVGGAAKPSTAPIA